MSYIDTFNHSYVGSFADLPVYHPLGELGGEKGDEFSATSTNLVIGGGSGEHPGMVVKNLDACVWEFLEVMLVINEKDHEGMDFYTNWMDGLSIAESESYNTYTNLHFAHWDLSQMSKFTEKVDNLYKESIKYCKPNKELEKTPEEAIHIMLGEFIFFAAPQLMSEKLRNYLNENKDFFQNNDVRLQGLFYAVRVDPKGYPNYSGRCLVDDGNGGVTVQWGLRFDEEDLIDPVLNEPNRNNKRKIRM